MPRELIGQTLLNQFRVENFIAAGGMATIYRVWDLQRNVPLAMKVLKPEFAGDPAFMARFEREARSLQMLAHPHIVAFYGLYRAGDLTFILERFIDGPSLEEVLRRNAGRPLPLVDTLVYFKALYTSLGYAHAQGIIHCDIKPGNVLIDQGGHVYLTDFGIAHFAGAGAPATGPVIGTPLYMAPEQIRGEPVTNRTDIYSLGVLLYELLSGQKPFALERPFQGEASVPPGVGDNPSDRIRYQQLYLPAPDPRQFNPTIPAGLVQVIARAMAKDPAERYPSVTAMADAISQVVAARFESLPDRVPVAQEMAGGPNDGAVLLPGQALEPPGSAPLSPGRQIWGRLAVLAVVLGLVVLCGLVGTRVVQGIRVDVEKLIPMLSTSVVGLGQTPTTGKPPGILPATRTAAPGDSPGASPTVSGEADFPVAGTIAMPLRRNGTAWLFFLDAASGQLTQAPSVPNVNQREVSAPQWSPDGTRICYAAQYNGRAHIVAMDLSEQEPYQLPAGEGYQRVSSPAFLPDGKRISFTGSNSAGNFMVLADAVTGEQLSQVALPAYRNMFTWNRRNGELAFVQQRANGVYQVIASHSADTADQPYEMTGETYAPAWSNDGQWLAFQSNQGKDVPAESEIWIARADGSDARRVTSTPAGSWSRGPSWSPDGKMIAFVSNRAGSLGADWGELFVLDLASGKVRQMTHSGGAVYDWRVAWKP
mgnify:CR=1 FL=1